MRVENGIGLNDYMTGTLRGIIKTMNMMISNMETINSQTKVLGQGAFTAMRQEILAAEVSLDRMQQELISVDMAQRKATGGSSQWGINLMGVYSLLGMIRGVLVAISSAMTFVDGYTTTNARLGLINDGLRTQVELQDEVAASANRARASYQATSNLITSISMTGAMDSTGDAIGLAEKVNKLLVIGGGGAQQNQAALMQFSQALASGKLQGDEYRSLRENAPALMSSIAKGMGVSMGELRQMSTDGVLTSEAIIGAFDTMGASIDEQFASMPVTFGQNMQMIKDTLGRWAAGMAEDGGIKKINDIFKELNLWLASDSGKEFLSNLAVGIYAAAYGIELIVNGFQLLGDVFKQLGPIGDAILYGLLITGAVLAAQALWGMVPPIWSAAAGFMAANLPVIAIGVAIAGLVMLLNYFGVSAEDITSFVGGLFGGLAAFVINRLVTTGNLLLSFSEFFANLFIDPVYAVKKLFWDLTTTTAEFFWGMVNGIIDGLNWIIRKINDIAGTSFDTIGKVTYEAMEPPESNLNVAKFDRFEYKDYADFASKGAGLANGFLTKISDRLNFGGVGSAGNYGNLDTIEKVKRIGSVDGDLNIAKEDLKYLLELTTQKYVNQVNITVQTAAPVIQSYGTVREEADFDKVATSIAEKLAEQQTVVAEDI